MGANMSPKPAPECIHQGALIGDLDDILCEQHERTVSSDNCVSFEGMSLQIPKDEYRCNYIRVKASVHLYTDGSMAIFHGPRKLAEYDVDGNIKAKEKKRICGESALDSRRSGKALRATPSAPFLLNQKADNAFAIKADNSIC
jgi:hypothetical protein